MLKVVDKKSIQQMQDFLAETLNVSLLGVYNGGLITCPSNANNFFLEFCLNTKNEEINYIINAKNLENRVLKTKAPIIQKNKTGLTNFCIPIYVNKQYLCCVIGGQFLTEQPQRTYLKDLIQELKITEEKCIEEFKKLPVIQEEKINTIVDALSIIINAIADIFYADKQLKKLGINYNLTNTAILGEWFLKNYNNGKRTITEREFDVLKLIAQGKNNNEIAKELCISVHTAKAHVSSIIEKFSAQDRVQVAVQAVREGLI